VVDGDTRGLSGRTDDARMRCAHDHPDKRRFASSRFAAEIALLI
jgi:hypothetical protein